MNDFSRPPFPEQQQPIPGKTDAMDPRPDHGEESYRGAGRQCSERPMPPAWRTLARCPAG
jgi:hypothetical protein